jgi:hypothetical protein
MKLFFFQSSAVCLIIFGTLAITYAGTLSCSITTAAACTDVIVLRMSGSSNAHAELPSQSNAAYANNVVCCTGVTGLNNTCTGNQVTVLKLSSTTNAHVQQNSQSGYTNNTCLSAPTGATLSIGYQGTNCTGYDTTLASMQQADNAHVGDTSVYTTKICGTGIIAPQSLSFSLSANAVYFGGIASSVTRYASSTNTGGSGSEVEAHTFSVSTNAASGYTVTVQGQTLTSAQNSTYTVTALGGTNTTPSTNTEQFGLRMGVTSGTGSVSAPYSAAGFAYAATATTSSQVATGSGDSVTTVFSVRYVADIAGVTESGSYSSNLVYVATANF